MRSIILITLISTAFAVPQYPQRIQGGSDTTIEEYPFMSNMETLLSNLFWMQQCGGALLTATAVLSSANCYRGDPVSSWRVRLGSSQATSGGTIHTIARIINHDQYDQNVDYDVAIVRLNEPAVLSESIGFARLAGPNYIIRDGNAVTTLGWGSLEHNGPYPEQLQKVELNVVNQQVCRNRYAYLQSQPEYATWPSVTDRMLCTGILDVGGKDSCQGDSGGPTIRDNDVIVGVVSWGFRCGTPEYPGVTARVPVLVDWIVANALRG